MFGVACARQFHLPDYQVSQVIDLARSHEFASLALNYSVSEEDVWGSQSVWTPVPRWWQLNPWPIVIEIVH